MKLDGRLTTKRNSCFGSELHTFVRGVAFYEIFYKAKQKHCLYESALRARFKVQLLLQIHTAYFLKFIYYTFENLTAFVTKNNNENSIKKLA